MMGKIVLTLFIVFSGVLFAEDLDEDKLDELTLQRGFAVYQKKCASCHLIDEASGKAPKMSMISKRLKTYIRVVNDDEDIHRGAVVGFIKDYLFYPDIMKGVCAPIAFDWWGTMPSMKDKMTSDELHDVSVWLYDNFEFEEE